MNLFKFGHISNPWTKSYYFMTKKALRKKFCSRIWGTLRALFVFSLSDPKQNARSLLTPVSGTVFYALSHGSLGFALHGSFFNHLLIG